VGGPVGNGSVRDADVGAADSIGSTTVRIAIHEATTTGWSPATMAAEAQQGPGQVQVWWSAGAPGADSEA
jgi:hypothetical protein